MEVVTFHPHLVSPVKGEGISVRRYLILFRGPLNRNRNIMNISLEEAQQRAEKYMDTGYH